MYRSFVYTCSDYLRIGEEQHYFYFICRACLISFTFKIIGVAKNAVCIINFYSGNKINQKNIRYKITFYYNLKIRANNEY